MRNRVRVYHYPKRARAAYFDGAHWQRVNEPWEVVRERDVLRYTDDQPNIGYRVSREVESHIKAPMLGRIRIEGLVEFIDKRA